MARFLLQELEELNMGLLAKFMQSKPQYQFQFLKDRQSFGNNVKNSPAYFAASEIDVVGETLNKESNFSQSSDRFNTQA